MRKEVKNTQRKGGKEGRRGRIHKKGREKRNTDGVSKKTRQK